MADSHVAAVAWEIMKETDLGTDDEIDSKAEELKGQTKEAVGDATDQDLAAEGQTDQSKSNLKQAGEKVKDTFQS